MLCLLGTNVSAENKPGTGPRRKGARANHPPVPSNGQKAWGAWRVLREAPCRTAPAGQDLDPVLPTLHGSPGVKSLLEKGWVTWNLSLWWRPREAAPQAALGGSVLPSQCPAGATQSWDITGMVKGGDTTQGTPLPAPALAALRPGLATSRSRGRGDLPGVALQQCWGLSIPSALPAASPTGHTALGQGWTLPLG